jgi:hypothetical protein
VIRDLCPPLLREQFTRVADWFKWKEDREGGSEKVPTHPPAWAVQAVHARGVWPGVPRLEAVVTHPILLGDGSLLATNGYHRPSGILMCLKAKRIGSNPLDSLLLMNAQVDVRRARRELTADELRNLFTVTRASARAFRGLTGEDRYHLYLTAATTGFRASALASLTPADFNLAPDGARSRSRRGSTRAASRRCNRSRPTLPRN